MLNFKFTLSPLSFTCCSITTCVNTVVFLRVVWCHGSYIPGKLILLCQFVYNVLSSQWWLIKFTIHCTCTLMYLVLQCTVNVILVFQLSQKDKAPRVHSLEYALHSLLRKQHHQAHTLLTPHPVTAYPVQGGNKRLCLTGPSALTATEVAPYLQRSVHL